MTLIISHEDACALIRLITRVDEYKDVRPNTSHFFPIQDTQGLVVELKAMPESGPDKTTGIYLRTKMKPSVKKTWVCFTGYVDKNSINLPAYTSEMILEYHNVLGLPPEMVKAPLILEVGA